MNIFLNIFFIRSLLVPSKLVIPLSYTLGSGSGRNYPEHYHLYEILCASLCIVIIQSLFTTLHAGRACGSDENKSSSIHVHVRGKATILIKGRWLAPTILFGINSSQVQLHTLLRRLGFPQFNVYEHID